MCMCVKCTYMRKNRPFGRNIKKISPYGRFLTHLYIPPKIYGRFLAHLKKKIPLWLNLGIYIYMHIYIIYYMYVLIKLTLIMLKLSPLDILRFLHSLIHIFLS